MKLSQTQIFGASFALAAFSFIQNATAQSCSAPPSCELLGYTDTPDLCDGDAMIKCPSDSSKVFCRAYPTTKTKVCDSIGDVLLDDKTCAVDASAIYRDRTPIGIIFDMDKKLAIAVSQSFLKWNSIGGNTDDIPDLPNHNIESAKQDFNGKSNTKIAISYGDENGYETPAADYCYNFTTQGTNKGDWYLPAFGELYAVYSNVDKLNNSLSKIGKSLLTEWQGQSQWYWSSTEYSLYGNVLDLNMNDGRIAQNDKVYVLNVRPVLAF